MTLLSIYLGSLVFGGILIGASVLGGHHDGGHDGGHDHHEGHGSKVPFLSARFWSFTLAFFGLTGAALTFVGGLAAALIPAVAGAIGLGAGYGASRVLAELTRKPLGLIAPASAHVGREGVLLLPLAPGQRSKVRVTISGASTDLIAETDVDEALPAGTAVLVTDMRGALAIVERSPAALPPVKETP